MRRISSREVIEYLYEIEEGYLKASIYKVGDLYEVYLGYLVSMNHSYQENFFGFMVRTLDGDVIDDTVRSVYEQLQPKFKYIVKEIWGGAIEMCPADVKDLVEMLDIEELD